MGEMQFVSIPAFEFVSGTYYDYPQVSPEGDQLFIVRLVQSSFSRIERYTRDGDSWSQLAVVRDPVYQYSVIGAPSAGPTRRLMFNDGGGVQELEVTSTGTSIVHDTYNPPDLGVMFFDDGYAPNLSADGLRIVFTAKLIGDLYARVLYSDRATLADRFRSAVVLPGVPRVADTFLTATCDRVYFSTVQSLFYAQRL